MAYRPSIPFTTALRIISPKVVKVNGVNSKTPDLDNSFLINAAFRSFGGTEQTINGVFSIIDTADIETWYRPDITSEKYVMVESTRALYRILGDPENIEMRNQFLRFKIERVKGQV